MGSLREALSLTYKSLEIRSKINYENYFLPDIADSLEKLGMILNSMGHKNEALNTALKSLEIRTELFKQNPDDNAFKYINTLHNIGEYYTALGINNKALYYTKMATDLLHPLADNQPDFYLPSLAANLHGLSIKQNAMGYKFESFNSLTESINLKRRLANKSPDLYEHNLSVSLGVLANRYIENEDYEKAYSIINESVKIKRVWAGKFPEIYSASLAKGLLTLATIESKIHRTAEAYNNLQDSICIIKELIDDYPKEYKPLLGVALTNLSDIKFDQGEIAESIDSIKNAIETYQTLDIDTNNHLLLDYLNAVVKLGRLQYHSGEESESMKSAIKASEAINNIHIKYSEISPNAFIKVAENLIGLFDLLHITEKSLETSMTTLNTYQKYPEKSSNNHLFQIAGLNKHIGYNYLKKGDLQNSLLFTEQAIQLYRKIQNKFPAKYFSELAGALGNLSQIQNNLNLDKDSYSNALKAWDAFAASFHDKKYTPPDRSQSMIMLDIPKEYILKNNQSFLYLHFLNYFTSKKELIDSRSNFLLLFSDYDNDTREVYQIPEVMKWLYNSYKNEIPWFYFCSYDSFYEAHFLIFQSYILSKHDFLTEEGKPIATTKDDVIDFLNIGFSSLNTFREKFNIENELINEISEGIVKLYNDHFNIFDHEKFYPHTPD